MVPLSAGNQPGEHPDGGGFPGAVGAEEAEETSRVELPG